MIKTPVGRIALFPAIVVLCLSATVYPQQVFVDQSELAPWLVIDAPPGWEQLATDVLLKELPGWKRDALGNLILRKRRRQPSPSDRLWN